MSVTRVKIADWAVANGDSILATIGLGSCVAIILHDARTGGGALAHTLLPAPERTKTQLNPGKYPGTVIPLLVKELRRRGHTGTLTARLVGGARMFGSLLSASQPSVGERNVMAAREALGAAGIRIAGEDVGGEAGRSVHFFVRGGRVVVRTVRGGEREL